MEEKKKFFMDCHLAGRKYHDADEVWDKLKIGSKLSLMRDICNRYDPNAVAVVYNDEETKEPKCIGYIPRNENKLLALFMDMGYQDIFECRISRKNEVAHPESQVYLTIRILKKIA